MPRISSMPNVLVGDKPFSPIGASNIRFSAAGIFRRHRRGFAGHPPGLCPGEFRGFPSVGLWFSPFLVACVCPARRVSGSPEESLTVQSP